MNNQTRNHLNLQKHIADQDHIIRVRNAEIAALRKRAEKAEQERDEWEKIARTAERDADEAEENPRPLTADDITDEMVERALMVNADLLPETVRRMLTAALTEPPARPEWEEEGAKALTIAVWGMNIPNEAGEAGDKLAASLARHGYQVVRVTGGN